jgi:hypothetical protein
MVVAAVWQCRHQDKEEAIVKHSAIATVSLGATRRFCLRHDKTKRLVPVGISINGCARDWPPCGVRVHDALSVCRFFWKRAACS